MKTTFFTNDCEVLAVQSACRLSDDDVGKLRWLLSAQLLGQEQVSGKFVGPRKEFLSPWSTNATDICENVGIKGIVRIERFERLAENSVASYDPMLQSVYENIDQGTLLIDHDPEPTIEIDDIESYNKEAGLALSEVEITYLDKVSEQLQRKLTDSEIYGFSQINSEHCRHKIFNGEFIIDGETKPKSLFAMIKETSAKSPEFIVSAYKDNVAFVKGPKIEVFRPESASDTSFFSTSGINSVLSLKAETHNFPTTVEPFYGASTGSGGEIRDRMAGGMGSIPLGGTAVYMTAYPRLKGSRATNWEKFFKERDWKYQTPAQILTKASNGASDFGNKFGQPLVCGSLLTFEGQCRSTFYGYDRCIMLAGGVGFANAIHAEKKKAAAGDVLVLLGGDNYRIGMAGSSVSSVDTGDYGSELELSAVQRANPEMQKRVYNTIRLLCERSTNPIKLIHDHGAGGHVNCFSELLEELGGRIEIGKLPVGDPTLSAMEIICNESQERMGLIVAKDDISLLEEISRRERAPMYCVGEVTGDKRIVFEEDSGSRPIDLPLEVLFGSSPQTVLDDNTDNRQAVALEFSIEDSEKLLDSLKSVLSLESVACKDWLTNKVDRCVSGLAAQQQCVGPFQLPLSNVGVMALDYTGKKGAATAIGHAPVVGLIDEEAGAVLSVAEALTNLIWAPLANGVEGIALSANWMWPAKQPGEDARLYNAVRALSEFSITLGVPVPTGKDSLSMTMKYKDGESVRAPGTVVVSAMAEVDGVADCVGPNLQTVQNSLLLHVDLSGLTSNPLGGSSFAQTLGQVGAKVPTVADTDQFKKGLETIQELIKGNKILAGHDISAGGLISAICEMSFAGDIGVEITSSARNKELIEELFCEKPGVVLQVDSGSSQEVIDSFEKHKIPVRQIGTVKGTQLRLQADKFSFSLPVSELRRCWFKPSYLLECRQTKPELAKERYERFDAHPLKFKFPEGFTGSRDELGVNLKRSEKSGAIAAVVRDKGTNGDREMAMCLFAAGFDVKDVTTTDLIEGRETLEDVNFVVFPGGFSCSDVLGAAKGWAGVFKYNDNARQALKNFYARPDTLSLGVCNGCQLVVELDLIYPEHDKKVAMRDNESNKFESAFLGVRVNETNSIMLKPLIGCSLGIWVAHGEGRFELPLEENSYDIPLKYCSADYPANPNGSEFNAAAICSADGRHLAIMPHLERSMFNFNWAYRDGKDFEVSPWILGFKAAKQWIDKV